MNKLRAIEKLADKYESDHSHAQSVARLSGDLFDLLEPIHGLIPADRLTLTYAALLHDIGWSQGGLKHHKASFKLIMENPPSGFSNDEVAVIANIARYHRKALPQLSHTAFAALSNRDREIVRKLSAIIRVADGLDASQCGVVHIKSCRIFDDRVLIGIKAHRDCSLEITSATKKSDLFEEVFHRRVEFDTSN